jgi:hypothetical protein
MRRRRNSLDHVGRAIVGEVDSAKTHLSADNPDSNLRRIVEAIHMPTGDSHLLREAIRTTLAQRAGHLPDADSTAEATAATWRLVTVQLAPVIGARGLDVLFSRALHQTSTAFPWLAVAVERGGSASPLPSLMVCLAGQHTATAAEASCTLLLSFTELLATLIGQSLTTRLLAPVWASPSLSSRQESAL